MNDAIRVPEVRLIDVDGNNIGVVPTKEALAQARKQGLDIVEISPNANPPVVQIADAGKYQYEQKKQKKRWAEENKAKGKGKKEEVKHIQIKPGTSGGMLTHRAELIRKWLNEGNRVQVDLFLFGRYKGMNYQFLQERLIEFLKTIEGEVYLTDTIKKSPKGFSAQLQPERGKSSHTIDLNGDNKDLMAPEPKKEEEA